MADFPYHIQIYDRSQEGQSHHGDADGVLMEAVGRGVDSSGGGENTEADGDAQAADGDDGGAGALQDGEDQAGPVDELTVDKQHLRP